MLSHSFRAHALRASCMATLASAFLIAGCAMPQHPDSAAPPTDPYNPAATQLLDDTQWELLNWNNASGKPRVLPSGGQPITLDFSTDSGHRLTSDFSGCNRYTGRYDLKDGKLSFGPLAGTRRRAPPAPARRWKSRISTRSRISRKAACR